MTALEALQELKFQVGNITYYTKDLKATPFQVRDSGLFETIEKELRAVEIIKPFLKNIRVVENEKGQYEVLIDVINSEKPLVIARLNNQEEYDLLKEELENEIYNN